MSESTNVVVATIPAGQALSGPIDLAMYRGHRVDFPAAWTAAPVTFRVSADGETFRDLYTDGAEYQLQTAGAGRSVILDQEAFYGIRRIILRSGTAETPVNQAAERTLGIVKAPL